MALIYNCCEVYGYLTPFLVFISVPPEKRKEPSHFIFLRRILHRYIAGNSDTSGGTPRQMMFSNYNVESQLFLVPLINNKFISISNLASKKFIYWIQLRSKCNSRTRDRSLGMKCTLQTDYPKSWLYIRNKNANKIKMGWYFLHKLCTYHVPCNHWLN